MKADAPKEHPSFFAILPASVRYDGKLSEFQKLLFVEITALADKEGYCRAWNNYFAKLYNKEKKRISKCISKLQQTGYITCKVEKEIGNVRKIFIEAKPFLPTIKKDDSSPSNVHETIQQKRDSPIPQKDDYSNTSNNSTGSSNGISATSTKKKSEILNDDSAFLSIRNEATGRNEVINSEIKREIKALKEVTPDQFTKMVCTFKMVVDIINQKNLQQYLYYPVWGYDFVQFVKKINRFCDNFNPHTVINKLAKKEDVKTVNRHLQKQPTAEEQKQAVVKMVDKEIARSGWKKVADILKNK